MGLSDPDRVSAQYRNASNLDSRITFHQRFSVNKHPWRRWVFDHLDFPANARILELGCGTAALWTENRDRIPETWRITLTDMSTGMLEDANANINLDLRNTLTRNFTFISTDAQGISFGDGEFERWLRTTCFITSRIRRWSSRRWRGFWGRAAFYMRRRTGGSIYARWTGS